MESWKIRISLNTNYPIYPQNIKRNSIKSNRISFDGLRTPGTRAMFVFDLDGSFAEGINEEILKVLELQKKANAILAYATGRTRKEFEKLQQELHEKGISLPTPQHLISNNGQFIYENINGELVEDLNWQTQLKAATGFDRDKIYKIVDNIAHRAEFKFNKKGAKRLNALDNFEQVRQSDPHFFDSRISYYEWNASANMIEYFIGAGANLSRFKQEIEKELGKSGMKTKFIEKRYSKKIMDACPTSILLQSNPLRRHFDGSMRTLFLCPADKGDGIEYLIKKVGVDNSEVVMAGNDNNDCSMVRLVKKGLHFICINNPASILRECAETALKLLPESLKNNIFFSIHGGVKGILEGLNKIMQQ